MFVLEVATLEKNVSGQNFMVTDSQRGRIPESKDGIGVDVLNLWLSYFYWNSAGF